MSGLDDLIKGVAGGQGGGLGDLLGGLAGGGGGGGAGDSAGGLEDILGGLVGGGETEGGGSPGGMGGLLVALLPMLGGMLAGGGLEKVLSGFQANGLAAEADSWVGTGDNAAITGADVRRVVGDDRIAQIAAELGVSEDEAAEAVAALLPAVVDGVSPDGRLAPESELEPAFDAFEQFGGETRRR